MPTSSQPGLLRWLCRIYSLMMLTYPSTFRREYRREMTLVFCNRARDVLQTKTSWALLPFCVLMVLDWLRTTVRERKAMDANDVKFGLRPWDFRRALPVAAIPAAAFALHDLVFQLPDNQHEPTLGFFLTVAGLLFVWGMCGYIATRRVSGSGAAMRMGAVAGMMSVGILWLAFIILNNVFIDRMSYEPDRIRAFQNSGFSTMRAYVNYGLVFSSFFPVFMSVAAIAAAVGGAMRSLTQRRAD